MTKKLLLTFMSLIFIFNALHPSADPIKSAFDNQPWNFLEYKLIEQPHKDKRTSARIFSQLAKSNITINFPLVTALLYCTQQSIIKPEVSVAIQFFALCVLTPIAFCIIRHQENKIIERNALKSFINNWPLNESHTPEEMKKTFSELSTLSDTEFNQTWNDILSVIKHHIYQAFPEKYRHKLEAHDNYFYRTNTTYVKHYTI